jgi:hypothetical protein
VLFLGRAEEGAGGSVFLSTTIASRLGQTTPQSNAKNSAHFPARIAPGFLRRVENSRVAAERPDGKAS